MSTTKYIRPVVSIIYSKCIVFILHRHYAIMSRTKIEIDLVLLFLIDYCTIINIKVSLLNETEFHITGFV
jgi:hypothetical protein